LADYALPPAALRADPGVGRLVRSLGLSDRFRFYLLVVEGAPAARAVAALLQQEVAAAREVQVCVMRLDPYRLPADWRGGIPWRLLVDEVLVPLVEAGPEVARAEAIVMVDASAAPEADGEAWRVLFQRMNERRNLVAAGLRGALVLAMPPWMERVFAHAAPDFWSIRSLSVAIPSSAGS
jgi:hypothetical protein